MATAEVDRRPQERPARRRPFANFVKRLANFNKSDDKDKKNSSRQDKSHGSVPVKQKKNNTFAGKNNPYPESGHLRAPQQASQPSFGTSGREPYDDNASYSSGPESTVQDRDAAGHGNRSGAPTLATNPETVHSDGGQSRTVTTSTGAGALSSIDGVGVSSTFSSPNHSDHSLATTLTTIQSTANNTNAGNAGSGGASLQQALPNGTQFTHQYPVSPGPTSLAASAIPRHLYTDSNVPNTYGSATANNLLSDNASILTLASSSKRRRRSMDTDASVRAIAPGSVFGSSRESLPLSVLSGQPDGTRQSMSGIPGGSAAAAERASVYSSSGLAREIPSTSERNSYYEKRVPGDAKSLRSITNIKDDARSISGMDSRSQYDAKSMHDVASLRSFDARSLQQPPNERDGGGPHIRNGSIPGSIGSPVNTPSLLRQTSAGGTLDVVRRRSSDWGGEDEGIEGRNENEMR